MINYLTLSHLLNSSVLKNIYFIWSIKRIYFLSICCSSNLVDSGIAQDVELEEMMSKATNDNECYKVAEQLIIIDIQFHSTLFEMTKNKSLIDFQYILRHLFTLHTPRIKYNYYTTNIVSHFGLLGLLRNGTPDSFRMAMRLHLETQFEKMEAILEKTVTKQ